MQLQTAVGVTKKLRNGATETLDMPQGLSTCAASLSPIIECQLCLNRQPGCALDLHTRRPCPVLLMVSKPQWTLAAVLDGRQMLGCLHAGMVQGWTAPNVAENAGVLTCTRMSAPLRGSRP